MQGANERAILSQKTHAPGHGLGLRWLVALSTLPLLGVVGAFGISPSSVSEQPTIPLQQVVEAVYVGAHPVPMDDSAKRFWREERLRRGDTTGTLFTRLRVDDPEALLMLSRTLGSKLYSIPVDSIVKAVTDHQGRLLEVEFLTDSGRTKLKRGADGFESATSAAPTLERRVEMKSGKVDGSLSFFAALDEAGVPDAIATQLAKVFSGDIDFHRDLRRGDRFAIVYDMEYSDGTLVGPGRIQVAEFVNHGRLNRAMYFEDELGRGDYYTPEGRNMRKAFLRAPLEVSRVTSGFTEARLHPILGTWRAHKGIDYGAPIGTAVRATGEGVVVSMGHQAGYGNVITLRHLNGYTTLYGHLSDFSKGLRVGSGVQQGEVIGFVGMTGLATGPHLHYEFHVQGNHLDPLTFSAEPGPSVTQRYRAAFDSVAKQHLSRLQLIRNANLAALE